jgi:hypothetical protein
MNHGRFVHLLKAQGEPNLREDYEKYTGRRRKAHNMRETCDTEQQDSDDIKAGQPVVEGSRKGVKFGLSAYCDHALPALRLKPNSTSRAKYHEAKIEELKSHEEKGTWKVVPLR